MPEDASGVGDSAPDRASNRPADPAIDDATDPAADTAADPGATPDEVAAGAGKPRPEVPVLGGGGVGDGDGDGDGDGVGDVDDLDVDDLLDGGPSRSPMPLDDRLWRHPSELAAAGPPAALQPQSPPRRRRSPGPRPSRQPTAGRSRGRTLDRRARSAQRLTAVGLAGAVGALLAAGLLAATGQLSRTTLALPTTTVPALVEPVSSVTALDAQTVATRAQGGVLAVIAVRPDGSTERASAVVLPGGYALTSRHVVDGASTVTVERATGPTAARVLGSDRDTDLALLAVDGSGGDASALASSVVLRPGDEAIGVSAAPAPGLGPTVTVGSVAALDRSTTAGGVTMRGLVQLDRPVPPEGAGGALVDATGAVVGVLVPAASPASPWGFAVPADAAADVADQLIRTGRVARAWLGIEASDATTTAHGCAITTVRPGSPALRAGLAPGDVVTRIDGDEVSTMDGLLRMLLGLHPGETIQVDYVRAGTAMTRQITLAARP